MNDENQNPIEEQVRELLAKKIGLLPEEIEAGQRFLKTNRNLLNFYSNEYGLHLGPEQQSQIAQLVHACDLLVLHISQLEFQFKMLEIKALKATLTSQSFQVNATMRNQLLNQFEFVQNGLVQLSYKTGKLVEQFQHEHQKNEPTKK